MSIEAKIKFGVTMNPKMGTKKMTKAWFGDGKDNPGVTEEIKELYPDLHSKMEECRTINETLDLKAKAKEIAKDISDATALAIAIASGALVGVVTLAADLAVELAALADVELSISIQAGCKKELHQEVDKIIPEYLPDEEN